MPNFDPKKLKKVPQNRLIESANLIGIKNPAKVSKDTLTKAFMDAVEAMGETERGEMDDKAIKMYNELLVIFDLAEKEEGEEAGAKEPEEKKGKKAPAPKKGAPAAPREKYTRVMSIIDAIKKMKHGKVLDLGEKANELYVAKGGRDIVRESKYLSKVICSAFQEWELMEGDTKTFKLIK